MGVVVDLIVFIVIGVHAERSCLVHVRRPDTDTQSACSINGDKTHTPHGYGVDRNVHHDDGQHSASIVSSKMAEMKYHNVLHSGHELGYRYRLIASVSARCGVQHGVDESHAKWEFFCHCVPDVEHYVKEQVRAAA